MNDLTNFHVYNISRIFSSGLPSNGRYVGGGLMDVCTLEIISTKYNHFYDKNGNEIIKYIVKVQRVQSFMYVESTKNGLNYETKIFLMDNKD